MIAESELKRIKYAIEIVRQFKKPVDSWAAACLDEIYFKHKFAESVVRTSGDGLVYSPVGLRIVALQEHQAKLVDVVIFPDGEPVRIRQQLRREVRAMEEPKIKEQDLDFFKKLYPPTGSFVFGALELGKKLDGQDLLQVLYPVEYISLMKGAGVTDENVVRYVAGQAALKFVKSGPLNGIDYVTLW